jgi:signal transduction histidine kinase
VLIDYAIAAFFSAGALMHLFVFPRFPSGAPFDVSRGLLAPFYLLATVPVAFRRHWPVITLILTGTAVAVTTVLGHSLAPAPLIALPLYSVTLTHPRRQSIVAVIVVESVLAMAVVVAWSIGHAQGDVTFNFFLAAATWFVADSISTRRRYLRGLNEQREERQRLEIEEARRAIVEERMAIARELHDVVAHSLSVIAIQSGVGRHVLDTQPDEARQALAAVESTSRAALEELRGVLGVLRRGDDDHVSTSPTPDLGDLDELVNRIRAAGVPVEVRVTGRVRALPQGLELTLYRIVQEALTNVVKHTASASTTVALDYLSDEVLVEVRNEGTATARELSPVGAGSRAGTGHGIIGMTERARSFGGTLHTVSLDDGGFVVSARLRTKDVS